MNFVTKRSWNNDRDNIFDYEQPFEYNSQYQNVWTLKRSNFRYSDHYDARYGDEHEMNDINNVLGLQAAKHEQMVDYFRYGEDIPFARKIKNLFI